MTSVLAQKLLNEHEVAKACALSVATLRKWRTQKRGPRFVKLGSHLVRYRVEDVHEWLASRPSGGDPAAAELP